MTLKITFTPETLQDEDGPARAFQALIGATVEVTYKESWAPLAYPDDEDPDTASRQVTDYHPSYCDITDVVNDGLDLAYDDGSVNVHAPFHTIEEVKYL